MVHLFRASAVQANSRAGMQGSARAGAIGLSIAIHLALLGGFLFQTPLNPKFGGQLERGLAGRDGGAVSLTVSLIGKPMSNRPLPRPAVAQPDPLSALLAKSTALNANAPAQPVQQSKASLDALIEVADRLSKQDMVPTTSRQIGQRLAQNETAPDQKSGALLSQIKPCWKRALARSDVAVTLEVVLTPLGQTAGPPRVAIVGENGNAEARRVSVERALQAVAACLPYRPVSGKGADGLYRLPFGVSNR